MYTIQTNGVTLDEIRDFFEILAPTDGIVKIHGFSLLQTSDVGDAAEEILRLQTIRGEGSVTSGSGGSTPTAAPVDGGDAAFGGTVEANNTTAMVAGSGTLVTLEQFGWNVRIPMMHWWTPETRPVITPGERWVLNSPGDTVDPLTFSSTLWLEEIGG